MYVSTHVDVATWMQNTFVPLLVCFGGKYQTTRASFYNHLNLSNRLNLFMDEIMLLVCLEIWFNVWNDYYM